jgi:hypothetical protein
VTTKVVQEASESDLWSAATTATTNENCVLLRRPVNKCLAHHHKSPGFYLHLGQSRLISAIFFTIFVFWPVRAILESTSNRILVNCFRLTKQPIRSDLYGSGRHFAYPLLLPSKTTCDGGRSFRKNCPNCPIHPLTRRVAALPRPLRYQGRYATKAGATGDCLENERER